jgi:hypothetical protein
MKINSSKKQTPKKLLAISVALALLIIAASVTAYALTRQSDTQNTPEATQVQEEVNLDEPTDEQSGTGTDAKKDTVEDAANEPATSLSLTMTTYAKTNATTHIGVDMNAITNTGSCSLTVTNGSTTKTYSSGIQALPQYSTCKGFDVMNSDIGTGTWSISATVTAENMTGTTAKSIEVE